ncbi:MAG TPA: hypothetical protein VK815_16825 [Candidatus Acidoferrales bacterium]|nr:hypothetical protein [Candidatus Acidoferrales bacterium]
MQQSKSEREAKKMAAANRRSYVSMALAFAVFMLLLVPVLLNIRTGSPLAMVQAQVQRGEAIDPAATKAAFNPATTVLAALSNSISATAPANRPKLVSVDSNSLPEIIRQDGTTYLNLTFATLASFPFKVTPEVADASVNPAVASRLTREQVPGPVKALSEKPAGVTGFMLPVRVEGGLTSNFLLLRNQSACCYGVIPRVNEWVIVRMAGRGVKPVMDVPVTALGTFHVGEMRENGQLVGIYTLDCNQLLSAR